MKTTMSRAMAAVVVILAGSEQTDAYVLAQAGLRYGFGVEEIDAAVDALIDAGKVAPTMVNSDHGPIAALSPVA